MPLLSRIELCELLPHGENMCLLHEVESWDSSNIVCSAISHKDPQNPLRRHNSLESICGLEYAAQAMAVHIGLIYNTGKNKSEIGYIGGIKDLLITEPRLDHLDGILRIQTNLVMDQGMNFVYSFRIHSEASEVISGRASLFVKVQGHFK